MTSKKGLREADFVTSMVLVGVAIWVFYQGLQMPMEATYAGVRTQWYVSPGLLPMVIAVLLSILGVALMVTAIKAGGARVVIDVFKTRSLSPAESHIRFGAILLAFVAYVFINIPRVDYFLATATFLLFFIGAFYPNDDRVLHRLTVFYGIEQLVLLMAFMTGAGAFLNKVFVYRMVSFGTDGLALILFVALWGYLVILTRGRKEFWRARRVALVVALLFPTFLTPVFRYVLRVRLPHEGGIVELFHLVHYAIR